MDLISKYFTKSTENHHEPKSSIDVDADRQRFMSTTFSGTVSLSSPFVFSAVAATRYDTENNELAVSIQSMDGISDDKYNSDTSFPIITLAFKKTVTFHDQRGSYQAEVAYSSFDSLLVHDRVGYWGNLITRDADNTFKIKMEAVVAKKTEENLRFLFICKPVLPLFATGKKIDEPTRTEPTGSLRIDTYLYVDLMDIWLYNIQTGEIIIKARTADTPLIKR